MSRKGACTHTEAKISQHATEVSSLEMPVAGWLEPGGLQLVFGGLEEGCVEDTSRGRRRAVSRRGACTQIRG